MNVEISRDNDRVSKRIRNDRQGGGSGRSFEAEEFGLRFGY